MRKPTAARTTVLMGGALLFGTIAAHAAPAAPGPAPIQKTPPVINPSVVAVNQISIEVVPVTTKCGQPYTARLKITNKTNVNWIGAAVLIGSDLSKIQTDPISIPVNDTTPRIIDLKTHPTKTLDCKKPLGFYTVQVKQPASMPGPNLVLDKQLKPTTLTMEKSFPSPMQQGSGQGPKVWLRGVSVTGACGATVVPAATLHLGMMASNPPQSATIKLSFGSVSNEQTVMVPPQPTNVTLAVPTPLDCQAAGGIPSLDYNLMTGYTAAGKLEASEILFEPN